MWHWQPIPAAGPLLLGTVVVPGRGPAGAATFVLNIEQGAQVTYQWATDVIRSRRGTEKRIQLIGCPRESYAFDAFVTDAQLARIQSNMAVNAAAAERFLVGLAHEAATIMASSTGVVVTVSDTTLLDWKYPGARVVVFDEATEISTPAVVQSSTATTITLDVAVTVIPGMQIMPAMACLLDVTQQIGQSPYNGSRWAIRARAVLFGDADSLWTVGYPPGITTYDGFPVWDRGSEANDVVGRALRSGVEIIDRGAVLDAYGGVSGQFVADFARQLRYTMRSDADRQWFKLFMGTVAGRQGAFLLPSGREDLPFIGDASTGSLDITSPTGGVNGVDYASWFAVSTARRWLRLRKTDGTVHYRTVDDAADNLDGTQTLVLDSALAGALASVQVMEKCRFESDDFPVTYENAVGRTDLQAIVVED